MLTVVVFGSRETDDGVRAGVVLTGVRVVVVVVDGTRVLVVLLVVVLEDGTRDVVVVVEAGCDGELFSTLRVDSPNTRALVAE